MVMPLRSPTLASDDFTIGALNMLTTVIQIPGNVGSQYGMVTALRSGLSLYGPGVDNAVITGEFVEKNCSSKYSGSS